MKDDLRMAYLENSYEKLTKLGANAEEPTWLARNRNSGNMVIWKDVRPEKIEVYNKLKGINHRGLVRIQDTWITDEKGIVIEDYVSGRTLEDLLYKAGRLPTQNAVNYMKQLLEILQQIHKHGIIHRDISPKNLLISTDGVLKLIDFGIAREEKGDKSRDTTILGTVGYASPEQFGFRQTDERTDIYAAGVLFNVMLTGTLPNEQVAAEEPYYQIIMKCIQMEPESRYQNAVEMSHAFLHTGGSENPPAQKPNITSSPKKAVQTVAQKKKHRKKDASFIPGFRTNVLWKKVIASVWYFIFGTYSIGYPAINANGVQTLFLLLLAEFTWIWMPMLLITNAGRFDEQLYPFRKWHKAVNITIRIIAAFVAFYYGYKLEDYVCVHLLGLVRT